VLASKNDVTLHIASLGSSENISISRLHFVSKAPMTLVLVILGFFFGFAAIKTWTLRLGLCVVIGDDDNEDDGDDLGK